MNKQTQEELVKRLKNFEITSHTHSPTQAEQQLVEILVPLLADEGYEVYQNSRLNDTGIDFIAKKMVNNKDSLTIGIEYKHYRRPVSANVVRQLFGVAWVNSFDRTILLTNSKFTNQAREVAKKIEPVTIELMDLGSLTEWIQGISENQQDHDSPIQTAVSLLSKTFAQLIAKNPDFLDQIQWFDLERMMAEVFGGLGFSVELTPPSKDGGRDIILECNVTGRQYSYIVELKHWRSGQRVGKNSVSHFIDIVVKENRDAGLFLSSHGFTKTAFESLTEIGRTKVKYGEGEKIVSLCQTYVKIKSGIWSPPFQLPEILFQETS